MTFILSLSLVVCLAIIGILVWYTRKLINNLNYAVKNMDDMQQLFTEYGNLLEPLANLENYYGEPAIDSAIANTKLVIQACGVYKKAVLEGTDEETQENNETAKEAKEAAKEELPKRGAVIGSIRP